MLGSNRRPLPCEGSVIVWPPYPASAISASPAYAVTVVSANRILPPPTGPPRAKREPGQDPRAKDERPGGSRTTHRVGGTVPRLRVEPAVRAGPFGRRFEEVARGGLLRLLAQETLLDCPSYSALHEPWQQRVREP